MQSVNRHSTVTHYKRPNMTHLQEGGTGEEVSEILFFSAKSKRRPSLIYSMQIIPVCLSIVARRKGVSATRRGGSNWTPISQFERDFIVERTQAGLVDESLSSPTKGWSRPEPISAMD